MKKVSRRTVLQGSAAALATASLSHRIGAAEASLQSAKLKGNINQSVCRWCYSKTPLDELCRAGRKMGLQSVELLELNELEVAKKFDLTCAMVSGIPGGITKGLNRLENHDAIVEWFTAAAPKVAAAGCRNIICFSGNRNGQNDEDGLKNCSIGLKRLMPICEKHNVVAVMELLNSKVNHADYQCDHTAWGAELCKRTGSDRFKLLYDIYHMQIMEGDVIATIKKFHQYIAHYHTGGVPGRHEIDDSQELYYPAIMKAIIETGFKGFVAQEFIPARPNALGSLNQGVLICDV